MAISGLAITFPLMNLVVAFCTMVSAGGSTISSIRLGQKDLDGATEVLGNTLMFCLVNAFIFGSVSFIFLDDILRFFGASNDTLPYARDFMQVILLGTPVTYTMIGLNNIMRATGYPKKAMLTSMVTVVCNIILAPIFIFQFDWGIRGAATATVISQFIGMVWVGDSRIGMLLWDSMGRAWRRARARAAQAANMRSSRRAVPRSQMARTMVGHGMG